LRGGGGGGVCGSHVEHMWMGFVWGCVCVCVIPMSVSTAFGFSLFKQ